MDQILEVLRHLAPRAAHPFTLHPILGVTMIGLLAALIEQRLARRRTPDFSTAWRDVAGPPRKPATDPASKVSEPRR